MPHQTASGGGSGAQPTAIQHVVVIFGENVSFDHYFATYPVAANPSGEPTFTAAAGTPTPMGLSGNLLRANPNASNTNNGNAATNPFRLDRAQASTADQDHQYTPEQTAFDNGAMDLFPFAVGKADPAALALSTSAPAAAATKGLTMGYFDGNTVTAMWNYAQHYSLNDHSFGTTFGPSSVGAVNLISGQTNGAMAGTSGSEAIVDDGSGGLTLVNDAEPVGDICTMGTAATASMTGKNIGDMLSAANVSWGWFQGGFDLSITNPNGTTGCARSTASSVTHAMSLDYNPTEAPFQFYASTQNLQHTRPTSVAAIGTNTDGANHQYDIHDFTDALAAGKMPAVSFLKAPSHENGHAGFSDPLDEQKFVVDMVNAIEQSQFWASTAIILAYDDSDGWYDHVMNIVNGSTTPMDALSGTGNCGGPNASSANALPGVSPSTPHAQGRCGHGPRLPLLVISPWAKKNYVDSTVTDQSSITRFIEDTFLSGQRIGGGSFDSVAGPLDNMFDFSQSTPQNASVVLLDDTTGEVTHDM
ncbi:MAG TPA: alkaline phosphatase family protein [Acidobacteriaceae bacterium]